MGQLNLYKIDAQKYDEFEAALQEKYDPIGTTQVVTRLHADQERFSLNYHSSLMYPLAKILLSGIGYCIFLVMTM